MKGLRTLVKDRKAVVLLLLAGCLLRLIFLEARSLWFDEANTLAAASVPPGRLLNVVRSLEGAPPLYYALIHFWLKMFADSLLALRAFSAVCGALALAAFIPLCGVLIPEAAAFAVFLAAFSSFWIHFSQEGRTYSLYLLLVVIASLLLVRLRDRWSLRESAAYAAAGALGLYTHNFFGFFLLSNLVYLCAHYRRAPRALARWLALYGAILILYLPWLSSLRTQAQSWGRISELKAPFALKQLLDMLGTMLVDTSFLSFAHPAWTGAAGALALILLGASLRELWRKDRDLASLCLIHILVPFAAVKGLELVLGKSLTQARYFMSVSPFIYVSLAAGLSRRRLPRLALAAVVAAGTASYFASGAFVDTRLGELSGFVRRQADRRRPVVHLAAYYYTPMRYYYLPERAHFLAEETTRMVNWSALPGYGAVLSPERLLRLGPVVAMDPARRLFPYRVGVSSGRELARLGLDSPAD